MSKRKLTLSVDSARLRELQRLTRARSLSAAVDRAVAADLARVRHLAAVDEWLAEMDREHGPVPRETLEWAARTVEDWSSSRGKRRRSAG
jgi:predicted transcriptional regulator